MINTSDLARRYAKTYGCSIAYAKEIIYTLFDLLGTMLYEEKDDVVIRGFGTFKQIELKPKNVRHPVTGRMITTQRKSVVRFKETESMTNKTKEE